VSSKTGLPDCCICKFVVFLFCSCLILFLEGLFAVTIQQALFIAPCSHAFHFKCLRPLLDNHYPAFICPLCRTFADLEADVEVDEVDDGWEDPSDALRVDAAAAGAETETEGDTSTTRINTAAMRRNISAPAGSRHVPEMSRLHEEDEDGQDHTDEEMGDPDTDADAERAAMLLISNGRGLELSPTGIPGITSEDEGENFVAAMEAMDVDAAQHQHAALANQRAFSASPSFAHRSSPGIAGAGPSMITSGADSGSSEGEGQAEDIHGTLGGKRKR
jgi:E3 ubiquitin-protein ligase DMA1/2